MASVKKVTDGIQQCLMKSSADEYETQCLDCPYYDPDCEYPECKEDLKKDTVSILKQEEPTVDDFEKYVTDMRRANRMTPGTYINFGIWISNFKNKWKQKHPEKQQNTGTYECFHCGHRSVIWGNDFDAEDYGYDRKGVVHSLSCMNCGADIEYVVFEDVDGETDE